MFFFFWILLIVALVTATVVVALREKKARAKALKELQPRPIDPDLEPGMDPMEADPMADDGFGEAAQDFGEAADDFSELDENSVK